MSDRTTWLLGYKLPLVLGSLIQIAITGFTISNL
jgi:hypothetical protein